MLATVSTLVGSRIPRPVTASGKSVRPSAARYLAVIGGCRIARPVKCASVRRYSSQTASCTRPDNAVIATVSAAMSISTVKKAIPAVATAAGSKPTDKIRATTIPPKLIVAKHKSLPEQLVSRAARHAVTVKIAARRQRVVARKSEQMASAKADDSQRTVTITPPRVKVSLRQPVPAVKARGSELYCPGRPSLCCTGTADVMTTDSWGYPRVWSGRTCECHNPSQADDVFSIPPNQWMTTPAEAEVDTNRPIKAGFPEKAVTDIRHFSPSNELWDFHSTDKSKMWDDEQEFPPTDEDRQLANLTLSNTAANTRAALDDAPELQCIETRLGRRYELRTDDKPADLETLLAQMTLDGDLF